MILSFKDQATRDVYDGVESKAARTIPKDIWAVARRKLDQLDAAVTVNDMKAPPNNRLMPWKGGYKVRINDQFRMTFKFKDGNATDVMISDTH